MAKKARNAISVGNNRSCFNRESRKDECSDDMLLAKGRGYAKKPLCYGGG